MIFYFFLIQFWKIICSQDFIHFFWFVQFVGIYFFTVFSYNTFYFCGIYCYFSSSISGFVYLWPFSFSLGHKLPQIDIVILRKKNRAGDITIPDFHNQTLWYCHKNRHTDQWNRRELRNRPILISQVTYDKGGKTTKWGKDNLFNK